MRTDSKTYPYVDTDILIRLLTGDDLKKQTASAVFFEKVEDGKLTLSAPDTVIADAVFVLSSPRLYHLPRPIIRDLLLPLIRLPNFKVENKQDLINALDLYATSKLDFSDCLLAVLTLKTRLKTIYSYDQDLDNITDILRREP